MISFNSKTPAPTSPKTMRNMLRWCTLPVAALTLAFSAGAQAQAYANVTIGAAFAPGVYGQIAIGNNPAPPVIYPQPIIVGQPVYGAPVMYLHVAPEEYRDWGRYCNRYRACGHPVNFVQVDNNNRWWEHHPEHLRGRDYYREPEFRHDARGDNRRHDHDEHQRAEQEDHRR